MDPESILIVKTSAIGDVVQTFPVLEYLRSRFPKTRIDWVVERGCAELVSSHPLLNHVWLIDTKTWRKGIFKKSVRKEISRFREGIRQVHYDLSFDFQGNCKSGLILSCIRAKKKVGFSFSCVAEKPNLFFTDEKIKVSQHLGIREYYLRLVQSFFKDEAPFLPQGVILKAGSEKKEELELVFNHLKTPSLMVCFGSKWPNKQLPESILKQFIDRVDRFFSPFFIFIWSDEHERKQADSLHQCFKHSLSVGGLSLPLLQWLMGKMQGIVTMDSAALHLCGTTKTPSFSLFGPSSLKTYKPIGEVHGGFQGECPYGQSFHRRCPKLRSCSTGACLRGVGANELFESFKPWWQQRLLDPFRN